MKNDLFSAISSEIKMQIPLLVYLLTRELEHHKKGSNKVSAVYFLNVSLCQACLVAQCNIWFGEFRI